MMKTCVSVLMHGLIRKNRLFTVLTGLFVLSVGMSEPLAAQAYSNFPYVADFGTSASPGADNALYHFASPGGGDGTGGWAMDAMSDGTLYPTYTENDMYFYGAIVTRPFRFTAGQTYRLSVVYESDAAFADMHCYWRLAAEDAGNWSGTGYDVIFPDEGAPEADANLIVLDESGLPAGESAPSPYEFTAPATGVYALMFTVYSQDGIFAGSGRHLRIKSFEITEKSAYDLAMGKIETPVSNSDAAPQTVSTWVRNEGGVSVSSFTLCYTVGATVSVKQTFNMTLAPNAEVLVSFNEKVPLSEGSNRIRVF